jgi:hypothetical protein
MISFMLPSIFNLLVTFIRCCTDLMMCLIHIDEFVIHVLTVARPSRLCVPFSERLDNLLDRLDNRRTICGSWNDTSESGIKMTLITIAVWRLSEITNISFVLLSSRIPSLSHLGFYLHHQKHSWPLMTKEHSDYYGRTSQSKNYIRNKQDHWVVSNWTFYL